MTTDPDTAVARIIENLERAATTPDASAYARAFAQAVDLIEAREGEIDEEDRDRIFAFAHRAVVAAAKFPELGLDLRRFEMSACALS